MSLTQEPIKTNYLPKWNKLQFIKYSAVIILPIPLNEAEIPEKQGQSKTLLTKDVSQACWDLLNWSELKRINNTPLRSYYFPKHILWYSSHSYAEQ